MEKIRIKNTDMQQQFRGYVSEAVLWAAMVGSKLRERTLLNRYIEL